MMPSTRRAALGALLSLPAASLPALAAPTAISADEARLLAIGPQLVRLLDEYDRRWAPVDASYKAWEAACDRLRATARWKEREDIPEWKAYLAIRQPADEIGDVAEELYEPFQDTPLVTLPAVLLRYRYAMTFEAFRDDALADLDRMWREGQLCA